MSKHRAIPAIVLNTNPSKKQKNTITGNYLSIIETELSKIEKIKKQIVNQENAKRLIISKLEALQQAQIDSEFVIGRVFMFIDKYAYADEKVKMYEVLTKAEQTSVYTTDTPVENRLELLAEISDVFLQRTILK